MSRRSRVALVLGVLVLGAPVAVALYFTFVMNPAVVTELRAEPHGARARETLLLRFADGRQLPVNYLHEGNHVYLGADFAWWKRLRGDGAAVELLMRGQTLRGHGRAVLDDPDRRRDVFARLRPTVPRWLPDWLNARLIVITLEP